ncbi:MAG: hypothetical protein COV10_01560 [Candidatus Vogelbacteria bacterium CG10_big_fil_rev_8_21_14_0_10_51_16]|uniref:Uncharacterized protein n=1 Tax=Candidatus Vogelbacteria bacterium CG10_big_fil_rev_8_21_14_0_10_51_16 TaxID=1975045 RepID=A0A2H0RGX3_9BACT|nr:MAG: hypothetical protein COV10_01560 [Candidatus Vogelbacteria bacterium CG10_big_fil_rev_8_21_14_0_10_51_16]
MSLKSLPPAAPPLHQLSQREREAIGRSVYVQILLATNPPDFEHEWFDLHDANGRPVGQIGSSGRYFKGSELEQACREAWRKAGGK